MSYASIIVKRETKEELDEARRALSLSWTKFFAVALPRCPACGGLVVAAGGVLKCVKCGAAWRLSQAPRAWPPTHQRNSRRERA